MIKSVEQMLDERERELAKQARRTSTKAEAAHAYAFLKRWSRKGVLTRMSPASTLWCKPGRLCTKIAPDVVNGLVKYGFATLNRNVLTLRRQDAKKKR